MKHQLKSLALALLAIVGVTSALAAPATVDSLFNSAEIPDESTLEPKTLQDWHPIGATRQKLGEINVAEW